jgi:hypothetical protein
MVLIMYTASCPNVDCNSWKVSVYHNLQPHKNQFTEETVPSSHLRKLFILTEAIFSKYTANGSRVCCLSTYQRKSKVLASGVMLTSIVPSPETNTVVWIS